MNQKNTSQQNEETNKKIRKVFFMTTVIFPMGAMIFFATIVILFGGVNLFKDDGYVFIFVRGGQALLLGIIVSIVYFLYNRSKYSQ